MAVSQNRRRSDRVSGDAFAADLEGAAVSDLRSMRDDCRAELDELSYARRVLHGQMDIVAAELNRRGSHASGSLVDHLKAILTDAADDATPHSPRNSEVFNPSTPSLRRVDRLLETPLGQIPEMDDEALGRLAQDLHEEEERVSDLRRDIMRNHDKIQNELVGRYRSGAANVDDLLDPDGAHDSEGIG